MPYPMMLRIAAIGAPPALRRRWARTWSAGLPPRPPQRSGKWTKARPRSNCACRNVTVSVDAGGISSSSSSTTESMSSWVIVSSVSVMVLPRVGLIIRRAGRAARCLSGSQLLVHGRGWRHVADPVIEGLCPHVVSEDVEREPRRAEGPGQLFSGSHRGAAEAHIPMRLVDLDLVEEQGALLAAPRGPDPDPPPARIVRDDVQDVVPRGGPAAPGGRPSPP